MDSAAIQIDLQSHASLLEILLLQGGFNSALVVASTTILGAACGLIGCFTLLRRRALIGDVVAHATLPGLCLAFLGASLLGWHGRTLSVLLPGALFSGVLGAACVQLIVRFSRINEDAALACVLSVFFGFGVVLLSAIQTMQSGSVGGLQHFIYGQTAALSTADLYLTLGVAALLAAVLFALKKELALLSFDPEFSQVIGLPRQRLDLLLLALVVVITVAALQAVGLLLVIALLIVPPSAASYWSHKLNAVLSLSILFGAASAYIGACLSSYYADFPAGAVIVLCGGAFFLVSLLFAPRRGLIAKLLRASRFRKELKQELEAQIDSGASVL